MNKVKTVIAAVVLMAMLWLGQSSGAQAQPCYTMPPRCNFNDNGGVCPVQFTEGVSQFSIHYTNLSGSVVPMLQDNGNCFPNDLEVDTGDSDVQFFCQQAVPGTTIISNIGAVEVFTVNSCW